MFGLFLNLWLSDCSSFLINLILVMSSCPSELISDLLGEYMCCMCYHNWQEWCIKMQVLIGCIFLLILYWFLHMQQYKFMVMLFFWGSDSGINSEVWFLSLSWYVSLYSSGNVIIETKFFDDDLHVSTSRVRLFYVWSPTHDSTFQNADVLPRSINYQG